MVENLEVTIDELIERVERATEPDRALDAEIACIITPAYREMLPHWASAQRAEMIPTYTLSLDAIVDLIEAKLPGWDWERTVTDTGTFIRLVGPEFTRFDFMGARNPHKTGSIPVRGRNFHRPDALALCAALLKALRAIQQKEAR